MCGSKLVYKTCTLNFRLLVVLELLYFEHHPALSEMGVDQVTLIEGQKLISSFKIEWWAGRWEAGQSGWHSAAPQPPLVTHLQTLSGGSKARVLVPLCGKAGCLTHLHKAGHDVVGELRTYSFTACRH